MQSVSSAFTAEETDTTRKIAHSLLVSWKKESTLGSRTFTIGVSLIGGNDIIGINPGAIGSPGNYSYFDESTYVKSLAWERGLNMPVGGLVKGLAEAELENTSGRFLPGYMGGNSELHTAILPRRPFIINAGFNFEGIDQTIPQFSGILTRQPEVNIRDRTVRLTGSDYIDFFQNRYLDQEVMFTGQRTDQVLENLLLGEGLSTAQYELDIGINTIPFGLYERGTKYWDIFNELAQAENGQVYQDEEGILRFENRQHWDNSPHNSVQKIIYTAEVLEAIAPSDDHIINVVEIKSQIRAKQINQEVFTLGAAVELPVASDTQLFVDFEDPLLSLDTPTSADWRAWTNNDGTGTEITSSITLKNISVFARSAKLVFTNSSGSAGYLTSLVLNGRPAKIVSDLYYRNQDDSSVTAYEERALTIENQYIQSLSWAESLSLMIFQDYADPEGLQKITILANPEIQIGDLISWQGRHWRIYHIRTALDPSVGFVQDLIMLRRDTRTFFKIGISTIGGIDAIAP